MTEIKTLKKGIKQLVALLLCMFVYSIAVQAQSPVTYTLQATDVTIVNGVLSACSYNFAGNANGTDLIIPDALGITAIADGESDWYTDAVSAVFSEKNIKSVRLPSTLTYLGDYAFYKNALSTINIPKNVSRINSDAFHGNNLDSVFIPKSVKVIGGNAFYENTALDTVVFETGSKLVYIGSHAFVNTLVDYIKLPLSVVPDNNFEYWIQGDGINTICQGNEIVDPEYYSYIAKFDYTLTDDDVVVENGVITSCSYDFSGLFITIPDVLDGQMVTGVAESSNQESAIFYGKSMLALTLPSKLETIGAYSFNSNSIDTLFIPSTLKSIGNFAFWGFSLDTVLYADNCHLSSIGYKAFYNNSDLKMVLPTPVKDGYDFNYWIDYNDNHLNGGAEITNFDNSFDAEFTLKAGTSIIEISGDLDFSEVTITETAIATMTLANIGNTALTVSGIVLPEGFTSDWSKGEIAAGASQNAVITFTPLANKVYKGLVKVNSNASYGVDTLAIMGSGLLEQLESITKPSNIDVKNGTDQSKISFPTKLTIATTGTTTTIDITGSEWKCNTYDGSIEGTYVFASDLTSAFADANIGTSSVSPTTSVNVIVPKAIGINDNKDFVLECYPVPVKSSLNIKTNEPCFIELFDAIGNRVMTQQANSNITVLNFSNQKAGVYFVRLTADKKVTVKQILKE